MKNTMNVQIRYMFRSFHEITPQVLRELGVKAVAIDVDNTIAYDASFRVAEGAKAWVDSLKQAGIKAALVTNTPFFRALIFGRAFHIPFNAYSLKPHTHGLRRIAKKLGVSLSELAMVGDCVMADVVAANKCGAIPLLVDPIENRRFRKEHYDKVHAVEKPLRQDFLRRNGYYVTGKIQPPFEKGN